MNASLNDALGSKKTFLIAVPTQKYPEVSLDLASTLDHKFSRIAYISLNKLITPLKRSLQGKGINMNKFFFIDGITKTAIPNPPEDPNSIFIPEPNDLTKLSIAITKTMQNFDPDCFFFDSLSTLMVYEDMNIIIQFVHSIVNKINAYGAKIVFTCLAEGEKEAQLIRDLSLILDMVIRVE
ncbi:hypothetical protein JW756_05920 [Candidatus Woesearchaeota archaeon]|nr:hypothetical protein [Candidatus Woesearchaeota archaeon]